MNPTSCSTVNFVRRVPRLLPRLIASVALLVTGTGWATHVGASSHAIVVLSESSNGRVLQVNPGATISVTLHSTYWQPVALVRNRSVIQVGPVMTHPVLPTSTPRCVPGQGCGTVSVHYLALFPGLVRLRAARVSCGEALACTGSEGRWSVVIRVR